MDEPTAPLTTNEVTTLFRIIRDLKARGVTIIFISHRLEELFAVADRVTVMRDGQYVATKNIAEIDRPQLIAMMAGREMKESYPTRKSQIGEEMLRVEHLTGNGDTDISFTLHRGEILGFAGLVGAGRTELMRVIYGADPMESGKIFVEGKQVRIRSCSDAIKNGIGYIPEDRKNQGVFLRNTIKWNTVINNIQGYSKGIFVDEKQEDAVAQDYKKRFSIRTPSLEQKVGNLSGGNQQKVVIAKTLAANSNIIIFDEPTRGIDVSAKQEIYKLMNELVEAGKAIIMVSSDMPVNKYGLTADCYPIGIVYYRSTKGLEDYYSYHEQELGRTGSGYVNRYNGNLVFIHEDEGTSGILMPVSSLSVMCTTFLIVIQRAVSEKAFV